MPEAQVLNLTADWWDEIIATNIGDGVLPPYDPVPGRSGRWFFPQLNDTGAVCIQLALGKFKRLVDSGCPVGALRLMLCTVVGTNGHAALTSIFGETSSADVSTILTKGLVNHAILGVEIIDQGKQGVLLLDNMKPGIPLGPDDEFYKGRIWIEELRNGVWRDMRVDNPQAQGLTLEPFPQEPTP